MTSFKEGESMPFPMKAIFHKIWPITEWKNNEKLVEAAWDLSMEKEYIMGSCVFMGFVFCLD